VETSLYIATSSTLTVQCLPEQSSRHPYTQQKFTPKFLQTNIRLNPLTDNGRCLTATYILQPH